MRAAEQLDLCCRVTLIDEIRVRAEHAIGGQNVDYSLHRTPAITRDDSIDCCIFRVSRLDAVAVDDDCSTIRNLPDRTYEHAIRI